MSLEALITSYGYPVVLAGSFLEGETIVVLGGLVAKLGYLQLPWVIVCAFAGSLCGDQLFFFLGRFKGEAVLTRYPAWRGRVAQVHDRLLRHQVAVMLGFRFFYGLRSVTPFVIGMSRIPAPRFLLLNVLGAALWATVIGVLGYLFGHALEAVLGNIHRYELLVLSIVLLIGGGVWLLRARRWRRR